MTICLVLGQFGLECVIRMRLVTLEVIRGEGIWLMPKIWLTLTVSFSRVEVRLLKLGGWLQYVRTGQKLSYHEQESNAT
jgi:ABC-type uncharacterized transport system YnjBCD permease subunit